MTILKNRINIFICASVIALFAAITILTYFHNRRPELDSALDISTGVELDGFISPLDKSLAPTNVIASVNGVPITVAKYNDFCRLQVALISIKVESNPMIKRPNYDEYLLANSAKYFYRLIKSEAIRQAAAQADISPSAGDISEQEESFVDGFTIKNKQVSFSKLSSMLKKEDSALLNERIYESAIEWAYLKHWSTNSLTVVTDEEISKGIQFVQDTNRRLAELNATNRVKAIAAKEEIVKKGRYFADVAKEVSEGDPEQGRLWDTVELAEFDASDPLAQWLAHSEAGAISDPIEMDDGLCIVGIVSKSIGSSGELDGKDVDFYELVRILFKIYDPLENLDSREEVADAILQERRAVALKQIGKEIMENAVVEFPSGHEIFRVKHESYKGKKVPNKSLKKAKKRTVGGGRTRNGQKEKEGVK